MKIPLTSFIQFPAHEKSLSQIHESIWTHERGDSSILPRPQRISRYTPRPRTSDPPDWEREPWEPSAGWLNKNRKKTWSVGTVKFPFWTDLMFPRRINENRHEPCDDWPLGPWKSHGSIPKKTSPTHPQPSQFYRISLSGSPPRKNKTKHLPGRFPLVA